MNRLGNPPHSLLVGHRLYLLENPLGYHRTAPVLHQHLGKIYYYSTDQNIIDHIMYRNVLTYEEVVEVQKLLASNGAAGDLFGTAVAMDGHILVIGSYLHGGKGASIALSLLAHNYWSFSTV